MRTQPSLPYTYNIIILLVYFFLTFNLCIFPLYILLIEIYIQIFFVCLCCVVSCVYVCVEKEQENSARTGGRKKAHLLWINICHPLLSIWEFRERII